jgi:hypothetical protein
MGATLPATSEVVRASAEVDSRASKMAVAGSIHDGCDSGRVTEKEAPRVVLAERGRNGLHAMRKVEDGVPIQGRPVVVHERGTLAPAAAVCGKQVRGGKDRVVSAVHVAAHSVGTPGRRFELHRALGVGTSRGAGTTEVTFDEVDRAEKLPAEFRSAAAPRGRSAKALSPVEQVRSKLRQLEPGSGPTRCRDRGAP